MTQKRYTAAQKKNPEDKLNELTDKLEAGIKEVFSSQKYTEAGCPSPGRIQNLAGHGTEREEGRTRHFHSCAQQKEIHKIYG